MEIAPISSIVWLGILFCITQSAMFSGLNLALLGISRLRLEVEAHSGNPNAVKILALRKDVNFLLSTVLWGSVGINVLLTILSNSVMTGLTAFLFSTILITFIGELFPQAYFSRHAMRMGALLAPVLRFYQFLLYPVAKPSAMILDFWLGKEGINYFREQDLHTVIRKHIDAEYSDVSQMEGLGAINFFELDDVSVSKLGEEVDPSSIIQLPMENGMPVFPDFQRNVNDRFVQQVVSSGKKWMIVVDEEQQPYMAFNANDFLREVLFMTGPMKLANCCHQPIVVRDASTQLGKVIADLKVHAKHETDDVIEEDLILLWSQERRVITGSDILGQLLRGIVVREAGTVN
jgi:metal transporter CNNM